MINRLVTSDGHLEPRFLEKSYREALQLTVSVADYMEQQKGKEFDLQPRLRVVYASESLRMTTCLMQAVSWLLVQKGVAAGELTAEEALEDKYKLNNRDTCLASDEAILENLPDEFRAYLERTQDLYRRVERMEIMLSGGDANENPVHSLLDKIRNPD
ncbi:DUF1465 family protein [Emcibacter nanhaiensis]|uniref:DUF1465 family protein n=1 Tax=Emcibacter nanhaiensis TaxID=1505037 RepID=A0A501PG94_9PROT|nr:DUF1465 family protein [Emcibacter nanhaiensis]TPD59509.1 DUF1465 family protein [Emcibacter nanhaiensis]